jgi:hypothetical protein
MRTHRLAAVVALALSCASLTVSCVHSPEADEPSAAPSAAESSTTASEPAEPSPMGAEHTGEAEDPLTKAECYEQYKSQLRDCIRKPAGDITWCGLVAGMVFAGCIRLAED